LTAFERVASYAAGMLDDATAEQVEKQMFEDPQFRAAAALVIDLIDGLRELAIRGPLLPILTLTELETLRRKRRVLVGDVDSNGELLVVIPSDVEFVAARLRIDLHDAVRVDVAIGKPDGPPYFITREAPFDPDSGELVVLCNSHVARAAGRIRVVVTDERDRVRGQLILDSR
jgi:hypothetical protein